ncbi:uncharacterized protein LOC122119378 isoform X2 [Dipodomys spectabilis]|uniref:uncharacterized protein LOC122116138 n=1 Tax=Dipodomys spectabilis TaxID=105255 RepID=UPI001C536596|nr:uncharacterized protein LOC122116138 [Dipodomys spectabilis]XP_042549381.1 uncharacterized protein LOC122119378 isoform X2 [Dipodomys spectabilis]
MLQVWARGPLGEILSLTTTSTWTLPKVWAARTLGSRLPLLTSTRMKVPRATCSQQPDHHNDGAQGVFLCSRYLLVPPTSQCWTSRMHSSQSPCIPTAKISLLLLGWTQTLQGHNS